MRDIINNLINAKLEIHTQRNSFRPCTEHGTADQTRSIVIESLLRNCEDDINKVINQLRILDKQLY